MRLYPCCSCCEGISEGEHGDGHTAPCLKCEEDARVTDLIAAERDAVLAKFEALHSPFHICDDCDHEHTDKDVREGRAFDTGYSYTCDAALLYIACRECCSSDDEQTEDCVCYHDHSLDPYDRCATARLIREARA